MARNWIRRMTPLTAAGMWLTIMGCGGSDSPQQAGESQNICSPGEKLPCECPPGTQSSQVCRSDGSGFNDCTPCTVPPAQFTMNEEMAQTPAPTLPGAPSSPASGSGLPAGGSPFTPPAGNSPAMPTGMGGGMSTGGMAAGTDMGAATDPAGAMTDPATAGDDAASEGTTAAPSGDYDFMTVESDDLEVARQVCVDYINMYRETLSLTPLMRASAESEACSDGGAMKDSTTGVAHGSAGDCPGFGAQNTCPNWPVGGSSWGGFKTVTSALRNCLDSMWDEGEPPVPLRECIQDYQGCFLKHGHYINMSMATSRVASCGFYENDKGQYWMNQNFQ